MQFFLKKKLYYKTFFIIATKVAWKFDLGVILILGKKTSRNIPILETNASTTVKTKLLIGFGITEVLVYASCDEGATVNLSQPATLFFILIWFINTQTSLFLL